MHNRILYFNLYIKTVPKIVHLIHFDLDNKYKNFRLQANLSLYIAMQILCFLWHNIHKKYMLFLCIYFVRIGIQVNLLPVKFKSNIQLNKAESGILLQRS